MILYYVWLYLITLVTIKGNKLLDLKYNMHLYWLNQIEKKKKEKDCKLQSRTNLQYTAYVLGLTAYAYSPKTKTN